MMASGSSLIPDPIPSSINLIAAMASNRVIGRDNDLPWRLPEDLKRFKAITLGKPILMGRRTFESIGRALPGRENLIVTRDANFEAEGCLVFGDLEQAIGAAAGQDLMVIGGAQIYAQTIARAERLYLTLVQAPIEGDALFPVLDANEWKIVAESKHSADERHAFDYHFVDYRRTQPGTENN